MSSDIDIDPDPRRIVKHGTLTLKDVERIDTAVYQCKAANKHGTILINAYVYVIGEDLIKSTSFLFLVALARAL